MTNDELTGLWWLPSDPESRVAGTLALSEDGSAELRLIGSLVDLNQLQTTNQIATIHGSGSGQEVTLFSSWATGSSLSFPGTVTSRFQPEITVLGAHVDSRNDLRIGKAFAEFDHAFEWIGISGLTHTVRASREAGPIGFTYDYNQPSSIEVDIRGRKVAMHFGYHAKPTPDRTVTIAESTSFEVEPESPTTFEELLEQHISPIQNLLTLAVGEYAQLRMLRVVIDRTENGERQRPVEIVYQQSFHREIPKRLDSDRMLFPFRTIRDRFPQMLQRWFEQSETLKPIVNLYFATLANRRMYIEHQFLNLVQAAESYHRRTNVRTIATDEAFSAIRQTLCDMIDAAPDVDGDARQMLKSKLAYLNELPLKERLRELLAQHQQVFGSEDERTELARKIGNTRNFLTHYDVSLEARAAQGIDLIRLSKKVRELMELCFLNELGFSNADRCALVSRHARYSDF